MNCPSCGAELLRMETRRVVNGRTRRYHCPACAIRVSTLERVTAIDAGPRPTGRPWRTAVSAARTVVRASTMAQEERKR